jgi:hypothetical protein
LLSLSLAKSLESNGKVGKIIMIDGSPHFFQRFTEVSGIKHFKDEDMQTAIINTLVKMDFAQSFENVLSEILSKKDFNARIENFMKLAEEKLKKKYCKISLIALFNRSKILFNIKSSSFPRLERTSAAVIKPNESLVRDIQEDYGLAEYFKGKIETHAVTGNHVSVLHNSELWKLCDKLI